MLIRLLSPLVFVTLVQATAQTLPPVPVYRSFGRWFVACDNTRNCVARGFGEVTRAQMEVTRPAGNTGAELVLSGENPIDATAVRIDGKPLVLPSPAWSNENGALSTADPGAIDNFIAVVRSGQAIALDAAPDQDEPPRTVPLDGFSAALLLVDAVQGRPGTPGALVAPKGKAVPPPPPAMPPIPRWIAPASLTPVEAQHLMRQASRLRSPAFDPCDNRDSPSVYALDATNALAIRPCYLAAYQGSSVVAVLSRRGNVVSPVKLHLPGLPEQATDGPDMVDPEFDPVTGTLFSVSKGRGLADCGASEAWVWSRGAFRLAALNYQDQCGGTRPGDWPTLYRTQAAPTTGPKH